MTVAEFAEAIRVRPVTVRSWITKGQLTATRAGQRKWLVRRSELARMLGQGGGQGAIPPPPPSPLIQPADPGDYPPEVWDRLVEAAAQHERQQLDQDYAVAEYEWNIALDQSRMAPPDARFASRLRLIAQAAARRAAAIRECMDDPAFAWRPTPDSAGMTLSYELRPGGTRPGPRDAWARFDRVVTRLGAAMEGTSASAVAGTLSDLATAMIDIADAIEHRPLRVADPDTDGPSDDSPSAD